MSLGSGRPSVKVAGQEMVSGGAVVVVVGSEVDKPVLRRGIVGGKVP
jgi:hypothetical protein